MSEAPEKSKVSSCGPGRKRCPDAQKRILEASFSLLSEKGWDGFSIEGVSQRAGVGKATIYRWWPDKGLLAVESFLSINCDEQVYPDTGCLVGDLEFQIEKIRVMLTPENIKVLRAVFVAIQESDSLRQEFESEWMPIKKSGFDAMISRAVSRGQLPEAVNSDLIFTLVFGSVFMKIMMGTDFGPGESRKLVEQILMGCGFREPASL